MHTVTEHIRARLLRKAGVPDEVVEGYPFTAKWWGEFLCRQAARFLVGIYRYSEPGGPGRPAYDYTTRMRIELERYATTGHPEALVELANYAVMAYAAGGWHEREWKGTEGGPHTDTLPAK